MGWWYASVTKWFDLDVGSVYRLASDAAGWQHWFEVAAGPQESSLLDRPGTSCQASVSMGAGPPVAACISVHRVIRSTVHLDIAPASDPRSARLMMSFSPWDGGCQAHLSLDVDDPRRLSSVGAPVARAAVSRALRRSLESLQRELSRDLPTRTTPTSSVSSLAVLVGGVPSERASAAPAAAERQRASTAI